jgi:hypothetical protein
VSEKKKNANYHQSKKIFKNILAEVYTILGTQRHSIMRGTKLTIRNFITIHHKNKTWQLKALVDKFVFAVY